jgi:hypothetical protein
MHGINVNLTFYFDERRASDLAFGLNPVNSLKWEAM